MLTMSARATPVFTFSGSQPTTRMVSVNITSKILPGTIGVSRNRLPTLTPEIGAERPASYNKASSNE